MPTFIFVLLLFASDGSDHTTARSSQTESLLHGYTRARDTLVISSEVNARCETVKADMGQQIGEDGVYANLDGTFTRLELDANRQQQAQLDDRIEFLDKEATRYQNLLSHRTVSQSTFDELNNRLSQARLEKQVLQVQAQSLKETLKRHTIRVPKGWTVIRRDLVAGSWVGAGTVIGELGDYRSLVVPFSLDANQLAWVQKHGDTIQLYLPDYDTDVAARLLRVSPTFDDRSRKTEVHLVIEKGMPQWRGGILVHFRVSGKTQAGVVEISKDALEQRYNDWWVVREDGKELRVEHLGSGRNGRVRIQNPSIAVGDRFKTRPR